MGPGADIEDERLLEPRDEEVGPFTNGLIDHTTESVKEHGPLASINGVERRIYHGSGRPKPESSASKVVQKRYCGLAAAHFQSTEGRGFSWGLV